MLSDTESMSHDGIFNTPPDTVTMKNIVQKHKQAVEEVKSTYQISAMANMDVNTPVTTKTAVVGDSSSPLASALTYNNIKGVILYKNPPVTYLVILGGTLALALGHYLLSGAHQMTFLTGITPARLVKHVPAYIL
jgi:hypothetical protein